MSSGADLFVVCKQCGSEVSPYITECPYCGHRLRRRAPKLPRENVPSRTPRFSRRLRWRSSRRAKSPLATSPRRPSRWLPDGRVGSAPYATMALVAAGCGGWVAWHVEPDLYLHMAILGPLGGQWWKVFTYEFAYINGLYAFVAILAIAIFGWLLERRHGSLMVLALFFAGGATGALLAGAVYSLAWVSGANGAALALLAAWAAPDLSAARTGSYYEGDLLGAGAIAALLLAIPFALSSGSASWLAGVSAGALGLVVGLGLHRLGPAEP